MLLRDLQYKITKFWQHWQNIEVYIDTGDGLRPLADTDFDEKNNRFVMIPEAKEIEIKDEDFQPKGYEEDAGDTRLMRLGRM